MSTVKFYTAASKQALPANIEDGAIYFIPDDNLNNSIIVYDKEETRYEINHPAIGTYAELAALQNNSSNWIPSAGQIVIVTDAYSDNGINKPMIKIGNGIDSFVELSYLIEGLDSSILKTHLTSINEQTHVLDITNTNVKIIR